MNGFDSVYGKNVVGGGTGKLVGTMAGATGDGEGVNMGIGDKLSRLLRVCEHLFVGEFARGTNAIFFAGLPRFKGSQAADFSLYRHATGVCHVDNGSGDLRVVIVVHGGFTVLTQRAVHHDRTKAQLNRALANSG